MKRFLVLFLLFMLTIFPSSASAGDSTDAALQFLQQAGISIIVTANTENELCFALSGGGSGCCYTYGLTLPYQMNWQFDGITNEEIGLFLDSYLGVLAQIEQGQSPEKHLQPDYLEEEGQGLRNMEITVSNALLYIESMGDSWLQVLLQQLALHDENDALNSLRARLASRMLGKLDITPVDPREGCAWFDALTLSRQDALPPVNAAAYVEDPLMQQLTQAFIAYTDARKADWHSQRDVENEKTVNIAALSVHKMEETENRITLWAMAFESQYALYDSSRYQAVTGSIVPMRLEYAKGPDGRWLLQSALTSGDGTEYYPSVVAFCDGDEALASAIISDFGLNLDQCFFQYLQHNGFPIPEKIPY